MTAALMSLLAASFFSATLLPGSSEAALVAAIKLGQIPAGHALAVATIGNTAGSLVNWTIGRFGAHWREHPRFPLPAERYEHFAALYRRWGIWSLLGSWLPFVGDPLTVMAGLMRTPLLVFLPLVALGKFARYVVVLIFAGMM
jgi:membrane protein YqaA with SNARE-associated domain